jgi:glyoxylase-like metal-dependent hydrolase (beta-lactamase superfamily II)
LVSEQEKLCIGGDVLFQQSIGRTDLPGGDFDTLMSSIKNKLFVLDDETKVYCGHGPSTTIGFEKQHNPFCGLGVN